MLAHLAAALALLSVSGQYQAAATADLAGILDLAESIPLCVFVADAAETFVATGFVLWRKNV